MGVFTLINFLTFFLSKDSTWKVNNLVYISVLSKQLSAVLFLNWVLFNWCGYCLFTIGTASYKNSQPQQQRPSSGWSGRRPSAVSSGSQCPTTLQATASRVQSPSAASCYPIQCCSAGIRPTIKINKIDHYYYIVISFQISVF